MRRSFLAGTMIVAVLLSVTACATPRPPKLTVCDGKAKHRRDANPYGSVLPGTPVVAPAITGDPAITPPPPPPSKTSAISPPTHFPSC